jgi:nitrite reductase (NAD(P)H)
MKKAGKETNNNLCIHFPMSRSDLFNIVKYVSHSLILIQSDSVLLLIRIKQLKTFNEIAATVSPIPNCVGCETCKPAIGSILSSLYNEHVMDPPHHQLQDTNDRYLANIQRNGTFSVIPRVAGGEVGNPQRVKICISIIWFMTDHARWVDCDWPDRKEM